ncbi:hypothetical protein [Shimazuella alba]|uniref:Uncharacterized protein n=1 Tax=Shimazuella alba TaxID=2690964 RepID=A0A6I4W147_9BACL|nr:hypothetical protein [Shimazuella alba]MXQ55716.1 hypothetical protein [Shimazuella alba]
MEIDNTNLSSGFIRAPLASQIFLPANHPAWEELLLPYSGRIASVGQNTSAMIVMTFFSVERSRCIDPLL